MFNSTNVKKIFYGYHSTNYQDIKAVTQILKNDKITQGNQINIFENDLGKYFKSKYVTVLNNGTSALFLAIKCLDLKQNSHIITTPITFISTVSSIMMNNLKPVLCDIEKDNLTLNPNKVEYMIKKNRKIKAIIGVDYGGNICDWESLQFLSKKYGLSLINDNCHAIGSRYNDNAGYAIKYADVVTHSYHAVKSITTGEGGAILTNNKQIHKKAQSLRTHGMIPVKKFHSNPNTYKINNIGYNFRITDFQCALGISQLKRLDYFVKKRSKIAENYYKFFKYNQDVIKLYPPRKNVKSSHHLFPIKIDFKKLKKNRKDLISYLVKKNIYTQIHYTPIYKQPFMKKFNINNKNFPITEDYFQNCLSLPIYPNLKFSDQEYIINNLNNFFKK